MPARLTLAVTRLARCSLKQPEAVNAYDAASNYWSTIDTSNIAAMIFDKNDDLSSAGYINYEPVLAAPDPKTPLP